jgi:UDP-2-acetamido-3-amino-2,3-dideoxy-glucuronate N-acetyltransferase
MVGAGAVVTRDVPADTIVVGNPGRIVGYVDAKRQPSIPEGDDTAQQGPLRTGVQGATFYRLPLVQDLRGSLTFGEVSKHVPFELKRYFVMFGVPGKHIRGEHAHRTLHQFLICLHGSCHVVADDGAVREEFTLDSPCKGLHVAPLTWLVHYKHSTDAVLLVLASDSYDPGDYVRQYDQFRALVLSQR